MSCCRTAGKPQNQPPSPDLPLVPGDAPAVGSYGSAGRVHRKRLRLNSGDRFFWVWLSRLWTSWRSALAIVNPETVIRWHRKGFCLYWAWKSRGAAVARRVIPPEVRDLIRKMSLANSLWGAPRIHGELLKLGINLSQATVAKYMVRQRKPPSQTWQAFLNNHIKDLVAVDFFTVPTVSFRVLYVFVVLAHDPRHHIHFNVTARPTAEWAAQQIVHAFPWDTVPRYLIRDRDGTYGQDFRQRMKEMGIHEVLTAPRSPWLKDYASHCTSWVRCDTTSLARRRCDSFTPWAFRGGLSPNSTFSLPRIKASNTSKI